MNRHLQPHVATASLPDLLRTANLRATPRRLAVLELFGSSTAPLSLSDIEKSMRRKADQVTIYRMLETFLKADIIREVQNTRTRHFELAGDHHHHITCTNCGIVEDIPECDIEAFAPRVLKKMVRFKTISSHSLELFSTCNSCILKTTVRK